ncbi:MAG TPA: phospholipase D family protein [Thiolapillus brandeum]|uniref:Phospholipase D family protein n=1 Tax=Thiolapillus brandeum TaxID=1076588 RepID=A0A7C5IZT9_9GAMM|nr:phospholipase D family protein [Thiolapillus brandeum]
MRLVLLLLAGLLGGCAVLPENMERPSSTAFTDVEGTPLGRVWRADPRSAEGMSAFYLLGNGLDAFVARAALARLATKSIDLQYYMIHDDHVGTLLMHEVLKAADRGVRVRILLDDIDEGHRDFRIAAFDLHPNIEVRIFNPFGRNVSRLWQYVTGFGRQTRRAHNKSFTVDNMAAVLGGRNIGDEYFERDPELAFQDLDVLGIGPVAREVSSSFDEYWNHELSYPAPLLAKRRPTEADHLDLRRRFEERARELEHSTYLDRLRHSDLARRLKARRLGFTWARARVFADPPEKLLQAPEQADSRLIDELLPYLESTQRELIVVSPYFVPGKAGVAFFRRLRERGVKVRILTNSLASTDVSIVHAGYVRYRKALLRAGVELWELNRVTSKEERKEMSEGYVGRSKSSLHAKSFVVDRRTLFIGSLNLDPRSVVQNTEIGVVIESPELAGEVANAFDRDVPEEAFRLELVKEPETGQEKILWHGRVNGRRATLESEPHAGFWRKLGIFFLRWLPIESQI